MIVNNPTSGISSSAVMFTDSFFTLSPVKFRVRREATAEGRFCSIPLTV